MKKIKYQLISASGNPTAIIYGRYSPASKQTINKKIFAENKIVEQIGYLYRENGRNKFDMMGNEFSANGCRAAGFSLLKGGNGTIEFKASGVNKRITITVDNKKNSSIFIPYQFTKRKVIKNNEGFLIKIFGSYLIVVNGEGNLEETQKMISKKLKGENAVGIMFIKMLAENKIILNPFFFVKETNTLVNETACGSGSIAAAIYMAYKNKKSYNPLEVKQPSGESIFVKALYKNGIIKNIEISGPTKFLGNYKTTLW